MLAVLDDHPLFYCPIFFFGTINKVMQISLEIKMKVPYVEHLLAAIQRHIINQYTRCFLKLIKDPLPFNEFLPQLLGEILPVYNCHLIDNGHGITPVHIMNDLHIILVGNPRCHV